MSSRIFLPQLEVSERSAGMKEKTSVLHAGWRSIRERSYSSAEKVFISKGFMVSNLVGEKAFEACNWRSAVCQSSECA
jgi:hypothetical protein